MTKQAQILAVAMVFAACPIEAQQEPQAVFRGVERIVAIGDVHGDDGRLYGVLRLAGIISEDSQWTGGAAHLVLTGDFLDRGPDARRVMDRLMALEPQAIAAGGRVHALLGNHEAMNLAGDLRYVRSADFEAFRTPQSKPSGDKAAGWREREEAFSPKGVYGRWLRGLNAMVKVNDLIFLHGGISNSYAKDSIAKINKNIRDSLRGTGPLAGPAIDEDGPLWYRGLVRDKDTDKRLNQLVDRVLTQHGASRIIVGHTIVPLVLPRFAGKVVAIDTALSRVYGNGPQGFLVAEKGRLFAYHRGQRFELPAVGTDASDYIRAALALDPPGTQTREPASDER